MRTTALSAVVERHHFDAGFPHADRHHLEPRLPNRSCYVLILGMQYRVADSELSLALEVALAGAPTFMIDDLQHRDRVRRSAAFAALAGHLAARMRCYDIRAEEPRPVGHPSLFEEC